MLQDPALGMDLGAMYSLGREMQLLMAAAVRPSLQQRKEALSWLKAWYTGGKGPGKPGKNDNVVEKRLLQLMEDPQYLVYREVEDVFP